MTSTELPQLGNLILIERLNSLFFNKKIDSLATPGQRQLLEAVDQLRRRVEFVVAGHVDGRQLAQVTSLVVVAPSL